MNLEDSKILIHVYELLSLIEIAFPDQITAEVYVDLDIDEIISAKRLNLSIKLNDGSSLYLYERYRLEDYELRISKYHYSYFNLSQVEMLSCDNSPHHPQILTFPHHKHYSPKQPPVAFSGKLVDFLNEVKQKYLPA